jgi:hypothetical protein
MPVALFDFLKRSDSPSKAAREDLKAQVLLIPNHFSSPLCLSNRVYRCHPPILYAM